MIAHIHRLIDDAARIFPSKAEILEQVPAQLLRRAEQIEEDVEEGEARGTASLKESVELG